MNETKELCGVDIKENYIYSLDKAILSLLLKDRSSDKNIIWATDTYAWRGVGFEPQDCITVKSITGKRGNVIKPRTQKSQKEQRIRIKKKAEVFTPSWICNEMANNFDEIWFGRKSVFNTPSGETWQVNESKITFAFDECNAWQKYVQLKVLEISCGEAPFLASRYDTVTGKWLNVKDRIGILDRKLRIISENTNSEKDWVEWAVEAYKATYGYEWQGDSLLIARENLLFTFIDYYVERFDVYPINEYLTEIAKILSWNIWQMDGLKGVVPYSCKPLPKMQMSLFDFDEPPQECPGCASGSNRMHTGIYCKIKNWKSNKNIPFISVQGDKKMKFDFVIGNPPYQDQGGSGGNNDAPIYQNFIMGSRDMAQIALSFIIPARWFSAGRDNLLGDFRNYMMTTKHLKSMTVFTNSHDLFPNVEIKGGVCYFVIAKSYNGKCKYTYHDQDVTDTQMRDFGEFEVIIRDPFKANIVSKVTNASKNCEHIDSIISSDTPFGIPSNPRTSEKTLFSVYEDCTSTHNTLLYHIENQKRKIEYVSRSDIKKNVEYIDKHKVFIPGGYGAGEGFPHQILGQPEIAPQNSVCSQSYLFAAFDSSIKAENFYKYIKTRFLRALVSAIKITQSAPNRVYKYVPIQDFTENSDIDWNKSIREIDLQLYKKYGLDEQEIAFIESHIKEMN